jgi:hypothetical protein
MSKYRLGNLATKEIGRDAHGREVTVQRLVGSGPVIAGDQWTVLVLRPSGVTMSGRVYFQNENAGAVTCVLPSRGGKPGLYNISGPFSELGENVEGTRDAAAMAVAERFQ